MKGVQAGTWTPFWLITCPQSKGKVTHRLQVTHMAAALPSFCSIKQIGILLLPLEWDASPLQGYPQHLVDSTPFLYPWVERDNME